MLSIKQRLFYVLDYAVLKKKKAFCYSYLERYTDQQLFLVPHADDDLLGGYTIAKLQKGNIIYGYYGLTGSNRDIKNKERRDNEFQNYCKTVDIPYYVISDISEIVKLIKNNEIKIVFLPSIFDWHPEHRKLNYDLLELFNSINKLEDLRIIWYGVTIPIVSSRALMVPMSKEMQKNKYDLFSKIYTSQNHMPVKRFAYQEKLNANGTSDYSAELFCPVELNLWRDIVSKLKKNEFDGEGVDNLNRLKSKIDRIKYIRLESYRLYKKYLE